jgi:hypothetical protein
MNGTRASSANIPCSKCLVPKHRQHELSKNFELRTKDNMGDVYERYHKEPRKTYKEDILRSAGLHDVRVSQFSSHNNIYSCVILKLFDWDFLYSNPYRTYRYDTCHNDHLGCWGHHLWGLTREYLEELSLLAKFNKRQVFLCVIGACMSLMFSQDEELSTLAGSQAF